MGGKRANSGWNNTCVFVGILLSLILTGMAVAFISIFLQDGIRAFIDFPLVSYLYSWRSSNTVHNIIFGAFVFIISLIALLSSLKGGADRDSIKQKAIIIFIVGVITALIAFSFIFTAIINLGDNFSLFWWIVGFYILRFLLIIGFNLIIVLAIIKFLKN